MKISVAVQDQPNEVSLIISEGDLTKVRITGIHQFNVLETTFKDALLNIYKAYGFKKYKLCRHINGNPVHSALPLHTALEIEYDNKRQMHINKLNKNY